MIDGFNDLDNLNVIYRWIQLKKNEIEAFRKIDAASFEAFIHEDYVRT
jgi:predicted P-loop ATPase